LCRNKWRLWVRWPNFIYGAVGMILQNPSGNIWNSYKIEFKILSFKTSRIWHLKDNIFRTANAIFKFSCFRKFSEHPDSPSHEYHLNIIITATVGLKGSIVPPSQFQYFDLNGSCGLFGYSDQLRDSLSYQWREKNYCSYWLPSIFCDIIMPFWLIAQNKL
jgi:hypothetical protein